jgi:hypothetical protein
MLEIKNYGEVSTETLTAGKYIIYTFITVNGTTDTNELKEFLVSKGYLTDLCTVKKAEKSLKIKGPRYLEAEAGSDKAFRETWCEVPFNQYLRLAPYDAEKPKEELMESVILK